MGVLYSRVDGAWVPIGYGATNDAKPPAYVGPRLDGGAATAGEAQFGNIANAATGSGIVVPGSGTIYALLTAGQQFTIYDVVSGAYSPFAWFNRVRSQASSIGMGEHPVHTGYYGLWSEVSRQLVHGQDYLIMSSGGATLVNGWNTLGLRVANQEKISIGQTGISIGNDNVTITAHNGPAFINTNWKAGFQISGGDILTVQNDGWIRSFYSHSFSYDISCNRNISAIGTIHSDSKVEVRKGSWSESIYCDGIIHAYGGGGGWDWGNAFCRLDSSNAGYPTAISLNNPGVAPQMRSIAQDGEVLACVNNQSSGFAPFKGAGYIDASTATIKKNIRTLRKGVAREKVHHDPMVDEAPEPNVMALRPVVYRPEAPNLRLVPNEDWDGPPEDAQAWTSCDAVGPHGVMGTRERLGLIAEDVQHVLPYAVQYDADGKAQGVMYTQVTVALLDHVQQLTRTIETLQYRIAELESTR